MRAKRRTVLKGFDYMHCDDLARFLMDMAAKGWHFKEWGVGLKFEKGEPEQAVYAVEVFTKASENDMRPAPNTQEFAEYCESAGWKFIDAKQKYCIFKKIDKNAVDLFTPEERVENTFKGTLSGSAWLLFFLYGLNAFMQWERLSHSFENVIFTSGFLFSLSVWNVLFLWQLLTFIHAFWKKQKLMKEIRSGEEIYIGSRKDGKSYISWKDMYTGILILLLMYYFFAMDLDLTIIKVIMVGGTLGFAALLNKIRPERDTGMMLGIGFAVVIIFTLMISVMGSISGNGADTELKKENLPVQISDYRESKDKIRDISYYHERNVFGSAEKYYVFGEEESIYYYIYKSSHPTILDKVWEDIISGEKYNEGAVDCTKDWAAKKAIRNNVGTYYVRYDDAILEFSDNKDVYLTKEQINTILDNLELR